MLNRLLLKVTKFQLPPPKHLGTVVKNILGAIMPPPMSNRVKAYSQELCSYTVSNRQSFAGNWKYTSQNKDQ